MKKIGCTALLALTVYQSSDGCSCQAASVAAAIKEYNTIVTARIIRSTELKKAPGRDPYGWFVGGMYIVQAVVIQDFKFDNRISRPDTLYLATSRGGANCGINFMIGQRYIIYGNKVPDSVAQAISPHSLIEVNLCSRTRPYSQLEALRISKNLKLEHPTQAAK